MYFGAGVLNLLQSISPHGISIYRLAHDADLFDVNFSGATIHVPLCINRIGPDDEGAGNGNTLLNVGTALGSAIAGLVASFESNLVLGKYTPFEQIVITDVNLSFSFPVVLLETVFTPSKDRETLKKEKRSQMVLKVSMKRFRAACK